MSSSPHFGTGQTHLNSDAKIADEGRPQGAPLPIAFSRRYALGRAPTRGAPTNCLLSALCPGEGTHKGRPYQLPSLGVMPWGGHPQGAPLPIAFSRRYALGRAPTRGAPTNCLLSALCPGEGTHKGRPYQLPSLGVMPWGGHPQGAPLPIASLGVMPWGGHPQGAPLPIAFSRRYALGRAPTRGAPTNCLLSALCPGEGTHKGRPYQLPSLGVMPWGGHPQGAPLPIAFSRRYALGRAPTRGAPTNCLLSYAALCPGEGTHKGRPYQLPSLGVMPWGGHPQGAPLPIAFSRRYALGRAPTRGAPTNCLLSALCPAPTRGAPTNCLLSALWHPQGAPLPIAFWGGHPQGAPLPICPGEGTHKGRPYQLPSLGVTQGTHKGRPYQLPSLGVMPWGGHPQGAPLPIAFSRRYALGRAPTRGAPTNCLLSALCPGEGTHKGRPYQLPSLGVMPWGGHPQGAPLPIAFSRRYALGRAPTRGAPTNCLLSALCPGEGTHKGRPYQLPSLGVMPWGGHPQGRPCPYQLPYCGLAPTRGAPTNCLLSALCPGEGTHKGRPYQLPSLGVMPWGGHPQGAPLPIAFSRRYGPGEGTHKGRPYQLPSLGVMPWGGHPQGAPLPIAFSRRWGRAPTRGAPTRFRQPHVGLSQFDAIALHFGMHPAAMGRAGTQFGSRRSCCKGNCRRSKDGTDLSVFVPERKAKAHGGHEG